MLLNLEKKQSRKKLSIPIPKSMSVENIELRIGWYFAGSYDKKSKGSTSRS